MRATSQRQTVILHHPLIGLHSALTPPGAAVPPIIMERARRRFFNEIDDLRLVGQMPVPTSASRWSSLPGGPGVSVRALSSGSRGCHPRASRQRQCNQLRRHIPQPTAIDILLPSSIWSSVAPTPPGNSISQTTSPVALS